MLREPNMSNIDGTPQETQKRTHELCVLKESLIKAYSFLKSIIR